MQFLIYDPSPNPEASTPPSPELMAEMGKFIGEAIQAGVVVTTGALQPKGTRLRLEPGKTTYNVGEAKTHLSEILEHVEETGEEILLTRRGRPVARVIPDRGDTGTRQLGFARGQIKLLPGWDESVTFGEFFGE